jgi:hypothetical protein
VTKLVSRHVPIRGVFSYLSLGSLRFVEGMSAHAKDCARPSVSLSPKLLNLPGMNMVLMAKLEAAGPILFYFFSHPCYVLLKQALLSAFAYEKRQLTFSCLSVRLSTCVSLALSVRILVTLDTGNFHSNVSGRSKFSYIRTMSGT